MLSAIEKVGACECGGHASAVLDAGRQALASVKELYHACAIVQEDVHIVLVAIHECVGELELGLCLGLGSDELCHSLIDGSGLLLGIGGRYDAAVVLACSSGHGLDCGCGSDDKGLAGLGEVLALGGGVASVGGVIHCAALFLIGDGHLAACFLEGESGSQLGSCGLGGHLATASCGCIILNL